MISESPAAGGRKSGAIGVSRVFGLWGAISVGARTSLALSLFAASRVIVATTGWVTPAVYLVAALLLLPVVLTYIELAGAVGGAASPYSLLRRQGVRAPLFFAGWLMLGGLLAMAAFFVWAIAVRLDYFGSVVLGAAIPRWAILAGIVVLLFLYEVVSSSGGWKPRGIQAAVTLTAVIVSMVWLAIVEPTGQLQTQDLVPGRHWITAVALLASVLWSVVSVLTHRDQVRRPQVNVPRAVLILWSGTAVLSAVFLYQVLQHPGLTIEGMAAAKAVEAQRMQILNVVVGVLICGTGASAALAGALRLQRRMSLDGYLPGGESLGSWKRRIGLQSAPVFPTLVFVLAWLVSQLELIGVVSATVLLVSIAIFVPYTRVERSEERPAKSFRLPLHPLFPGLAAALCAVFVLALPVGAQLGVVAWLTVGGAVYALYAGSRSGAVRRSEFELSDTEAAVAAPTPRLLLGVGTDLGSAASLIRFGSALAASEDRELMVLRVEPRVEQIPMWELRLRAEQSWRELAEVVERSALPDVQSRAIVRIAPTDAAGLLEAAREYDVDLILLNTSGGESEAGHQGLELVEDVFRSTGRSLAILIGDVSEAPHRLTVGTSGGPHAPLALEIAEALANRVGEEVSLVSVAPPGMEAESTASAAIERTLERAETKAPISTTTLQGREPTSSLLEHAERFDLLLIGSSADRLLKQTVSGGLAVRIASRRSKPTLIVKRAERQRAFWVRRLWNTLSRPLPTLDPSQQASVYSDMRLSARADVDYYVLMFLASTIATCGLLLDSVAVIVGAMLVAPLMSPILAIAQGVVVGNDLLIRRAAASTFKGTSVALGLSITAGLLLPDRVPTAQMLARGEPNILDLLVAVAAGAAAAYGVCRSSVAAALPGVAIAVALVPPLCVAGWALGAEEFRLASGALLLFLTNLAGIVLVGAFVFLLLGFRPTRAKRNLVMRRAILLTLLTFAVISIPLAWKTRYVLQAERLEAEIGARLARADSSFSRVEDVAVKREGSEFVVEATLFLFREPRPGDLDPVEQFRDDLERAMGFPVRVRATVVPATVFEAAPTSEEE